MTLLNVRRVLAAAIVAAVSMMTVACADPAAEEVEAGHDPGVSREEGAKASGSDEYFKFMTSLVERGLSRDYGELSTLEEYRSEYESGLVSDGKYKFKSITGELDSVGPLSVGHNPFGVPGESSQNIQLTLTVDGEHQALLVLIGRQSIDAAGKPMNLTTTQDLGALKSSAPIGATWIASGVQDSSGTFFVSSIIASRDDGTAVSVGPPIAAGRSFKEFEAQAADLSKR